MKQQPVQHHGLRLQRIQLDQRQRTFRDFAPAVHASFRLLHFAAIGSPQKFTGVISGSRLAQRRTRQRFHGVAAQQFAPVLAKEVAGRKDVAPGHVSTVRDNDADNPLALEPRRRACKPPLYLIDEAVDGAANSAPLIDFPVRLRRRLDGNRLSESVGADARSCRKRRSRLRRHSDRGRRTTGNCGPHLILLLLNRLFANAWVDDGLRRSELRATPGPATVLDAEYIEWQRFRADRYDAILADNAVLLAAADQFAGQQQQRPLATVDEHKLVHRRAGVVLRRPHHAAVAHHPGSPALADNDFAPGQAFFQREKAAGVLRGTAYHRKYSNVFVDNRIEDAPIALRLLRR